MTDFVASCLKNEHPERSKGPRVNQAPQVIRSHTRFSRQNLLGLRGSYRGAERLNSVNVHERQALDGVTDWQVGVGVARDWDAKVQMLATHDSQAREPRLKGSPVFHHNPQRLKRLAVEEIV
jgi:hypothetical protein